MIRNNIKITVLILNSLQICKTLQIKRKLDVSFVKLDCPFKLTLLLSHQLAPPPAPQSAYQKTVHLTSALCDDLIPGVGWRQIQDGWNHDEHAEILHNSEKSLICVEAGHCSRARGWVCDHQQTSCGPKRVGRAEQSWFWAAEGSLFLSPWRNSIVSLKTCPATAGSAAGGRARAVCLPVLRTAAVPSVLYPLC